MVTLNLFINTSDIDPAPMTNMAYQHYNFAGEADQHINHPYSSHTYYPSRSQDQHSRCDGEHQYRDNHDDEELMVDNKDTSSSDADEGTEDGTCLEHDQYLVEEDHIVHENYITHAYPINTVAGSIVADGQIIHCESYDQVTADGTFVNTIVHTKTITKTPSRFRKDAGKAATHLFDEENHRKAVETFQNGVREVTAFVADVQAKQGGTGWKGGGVWRWFDKEL
jgi:hypothetical protein